MQMAKTDEAPTTVTADLGAEVESLSSPLVANSADTADTPSAAAEASAVPADAVGNPSAADQAPARQADAVDTSTVVQAVEETAASPSAEEPSRNADVSAAGSSLPTVADKSANEPTEPLGLSALDRPTEEIAVKQMRIEDTIDEALLAELREAFTMGKHPKDGDVIDSSQLLNVLRSLGIGLSPTEHAELLAAADPLGQGQIPWKVFLAFTVHLVVGRKSPRTEEEELVDAFRLADMDATGFVSFRDLQRVAKSVEQKDADRQGFLEAFRLQERDDRIDYRAFIKHYVTDRKWPPSYLGTGGLLVGAQDVQ